MELNNLKQEAGKLRLTQAEKTAMKARILNVPQPFAKTHSPYFGYSFQFVRARVMVPLSIILVVAIGAGTASAAQGSLPGQPLYAVKVGITEPLEQALASTPTAKAQVETQLAARRVEEAEALAVLGTLDATTSQTLAANFDEHASQAQALTESVATNDPDAASELKVQFDSSIAAHGAILASLAGDAATTSGADAHKFAVRVLARVGNHAHGDAASGIAVATALPVPASAQSKNTVSTKGVRTLSATMPTAPTSTDTASGGAEASTPQGGRAAAVSMSFAAVMQAQAADALAKTRALFEAAKDTFATTTAAQLELKFAGIDSLMSAGSDAGNAGDYVTATGNFKDALTQSIKLYTLLVAQQKFNRNIITPVLEQHLILNVNVNLRGGDGN